MIPVSDYINKEDQAHHARWGIRAIHAGACFDREFWTNYSGDLPANYRQAMLEAAETSIKRIESIARQVGVSLDG